MHSYHKICLIDFFMVNIFSRKEKCGLVQKLISTQNIESTATTTPTPTPPTMSRFYLIPVTSAKHLMPVFLTAPRQLGHMPPSTCHLLTTTCQLPPATSQPPPATCHLPPANYQLPPANCQLPTARNNFFAINFFLPDIFSRQ